MYYARKNKHKHFSWKLQFTKPVTTRSKGVYSNRLITWYKNIVGKQKPESYSSFECKKNREKMLTAKNVYHFDYHDNRGAYPEKPVIPSTMLAPTSLQNAIIQN